MKSATNLKYTLRQFYYYANTLFFYGMCATGVNALAESTDYYWRGGSTWDDTLLLAGNVANWKANAEGNIPHSTVPSETSNLIFDVANMQRNGNPDYARVNWYASSTYPSVKTVNSVTAYVPLEIHIPSSITLLGDWHGTVSSDSKYTPLLSDIGSRKSMRLVADNANFLTVGGDMTLETDKYFNSRFRLGSTSTAPSAYTLAVKGSLNFIKNGADTVGYHTFDMSAYDTATGTSFSMDLGGLSSSGKAVYMTSAKNLSVNINFMSNGGVFKGGDFEGVFATESGVSSNLSINMSGDGRRQSMTIYKASNASLHGFGNDLDGKTDMAINSVEVSNGELVLDSELSVGDVRLLGGALKLSAPKVERIFIDGDGGKLIYGGAIVTDELSVPASSVDVVFSAEDLKDMEITIFEFDNLTDGFDANSVFSAYGESGEELGGEFSLIGEVGGPGSLIYTVPEAAELASIFGLVALLFAVSRRRK